MIKMIEIFYHIISMKSSFLSAGAQLALCLVTCKSFINQKVYKFRELKACGVAHLREHTDWSKARQCVDFIEVNSLCFTVNKEIYT